MAALRVPLVTLALVLAANVAYTQAAVAREPNHNEPELENDQLDQIKRTRWPKALNSKWRRFIEELNTVLGPDQEDYWKDKYKYGSRFKDQKYMEGHDDDDGGESGSDTFEDDDGATEVEELNEFIDQNFNQYDGSSGSRSPLEVASKRSALRAALGGAGRRRRGPQVDADPLHRSSIAAAAAARAGKTVTPYISVGVLSDMGKFFGYLKDNLRTLAVIPPDERDALLMNESLDKTPVDEDANLGGASLRRPATAALLHALRPVHRNYKLRSFVDSVEPAGYKGANYHDPSLLWTGLGRRKR